MSNKINRKNTKLNKKIKKKSGFTLIELLAVIVILGILMLIAIPSVTKYINETRKKAYIITLSNALETVKNGVLLEDEKYLLNDGIGVFSLLEIELEKGKMESPYGQLNNDYSFVLVTKSDDSYHYSVQALDDKGYYIELTDRNELNDIKNINQLEKTEDVASIGLVKQTELKASITNTYQLSDVVQFAGSSWRVIDSKGSYVTAMKESSLTAAEITNNGYTTSNNTIKFNSSGNNDYNSSLVKTVLDNYANQLDSDKLVSINGYKVRLITLSELQGTLGVSTTINASWYDYDSINTPSWVKSGNSCYWTMTPYPDTAASVFIARNESVGQNVANSAGCTIRPVVNINKLYLT